MGIKEQLLDLEAKIVKGLNLSYKKMIEYKRRKKSPVIISRNGKVLEVSADSIVFSK